MALPEGLVEYINKYFVGADVITAYEAGFSGFHLHRYLSNKGVKNIVVHPAAIEVSARDRVKTDKRDALKIATQLSVGRLKGIHVPDERREAMRTISRLRTALKGERYRTGSRIKALLFEFGLMETHDETKINAQWVIRLLERLKMYKYQEDFYYTISHYVEHWLYLTKQIKKVDKQLTEQAKQETGLEMIYRSIPGIGPLHSRILANELGDMKQFSSEKKLFSFTGLTPSEYSSGDKKRLGHISRQGRSVLRKVLVEAAWVAIVRDPGLKQLFEKIAKKAGKKRAIVGIARRLVARIRACLLTGELYRIE